MAILDFAKRVVLVLPPSLKRVFTTLFQTILKNQKVSGLLIATPLAHLYLQSRAKRKLQAPILSQLEKGTKPPMLPCGRTLIERPLLMKQLSILIRGGSELEDDHPTSGKSSASADSQDLNRFYGVVIGPSGTGKTLLTRRVCNIDPVGVLYHEIYDPGRAAEEMAKTAGLILSPNSLVDLGLSYLSERYRHYHSLPEDTSQGIAYVLDVVADQAIKFKKIHGYAPCFVIDGVDLLAKKAPNIFTDLVDRAKYLSNSGRLRLIFVSSEGKVMPLILSTTSHTRAAPVVEVVDISDREAEKYLARAIPKDLAKQVVALIGGRFVHMMSAIEIYKEAGKEENKIDVTNVMGLIKEYLVAKYIRHGLMEMDVKKNYAVETAVLKRVILKGSSPIEQLTRELMSEPSMDRKKVGEAITHLVSLNFLRYNRDMNVVCHSRLVEEYLKEFLTTESES